MQRGTIIRHRASWTLLYYDTPIRAGKRVRVRVSKKLAPYQKERRIPASVRALADEILAPLNRKQLQPESSLKMTEFIENYYFPAVESELRPSTVMNYKKSIYEPHLKKRLANPPIKLRDFRSVHAQRMLRSIPGVGHRTLLHFKNFLSGVFKFAKREGVLDGLNPMDDVSVPGKPSNFKGAAYTLDEVSRMLEDLEHIKAQSDNAEPYQTAVEVIALLSFTGLRQSEARGLRWQDWNETDQTLMISRAVWHTRVGPTKNASSEGSIPVLPLLQDLLTRRRERLRPNDSDYIFAGTRHGRPLDFHNLQNRIIKPAFKKAKFMDEPGVEWLGYHGFRRGLASNLFGLGVNPKVIAAILRHSDISTTLQFYIQTPDRESRTAMEKLEEKIKGMSSGVTINGVPVGSQSSIR
jgi:integrase